MDRDVAGRARVHRGAAVERPTAFLCLLLAFFTIGAAAQPAAIEVTGAIPFSNGSLTFQCTGTPTCVGTFSFSIAPELSPGIPMCSHALTVVDTISISGLDLSAPGPIQGTLVAAGLVFTFFPQPDGTCRISGPTFPHQSAYTGTWDGSVGTFVLQQFLGIPQRTATFAAKNTPPPVFPMTVSARFDGGVAHVSASFSYRPQDVGTTGSVFVFAVAPSTIVRSSATPAPGGGKAEPDIVIPGYRARSEDGKDTPVQCVLAQLSSSGQLVGVTPSSLQAYITGVLSAGAQAVTIVNGVPTVNIGGATFYLGYGPTATGMINGGINRSVVTVPASVQCKPEPPQTGWWWNPAEDGRGYSIEVRGNNVFFASFLYDVTGRSNWYVATGPVSLDGTLFNGRLLSASGGQTLGGAYPGFPALTDEGAISLAFNTASTGTIVWPGGTVPIQRFNIVPNGLTLPPVPNQPESGWWWNPDEAGRGFFLEWQGGILNIAGYMYDEAGNPVWYLTQNAAATTNAQSFSSSWWSFGGGMTLMGPWRPHTRINDNVAPVTIQFQGIENAIMTLPNGRTTAITRHRF